MNNNENIEIIEEQLRIMDADLEGARSMIDRIQHERERIEYAVKALNPRYFAVENAEAVADHE